MEGRELKVIALVPARGGSKAIPGKNIKHLAGRPLIHWTLSALAGCEEIHETLVATDDDAIRATVEEFGHQRVRWVDRSPITATDKATTESVLLEVAAGLDADAILLVQATSPLLTTADVETALKVFQRDEVDSVLSVVRQHRFRWTPSTDGTVSAANYDPANRPRRQDFAGDLVENGAFYLSSRRRILDSGVRVSGRIAAVEMAPETYLEIDEPSDWTLVEAALRNRSVSTPATSTSVKVVLTDVDGVLTDSGMYYSAEGDALKKFNTRDGVGFELLRNAGIITGIITRESTTIVEQRATKLRLDVLRMGAIDKLAVVNEVASQLGLGLGDIAYVGDDMGDLPLLRAVGFSAAPRDAIPEVLATVDYVCTAAGGEGVLRELAELVLASHPMDSKTRPELLL